MGRPVFEFSAWSGPIPVTWTATCDVDRNALELRFEHIVSRWTKGMKVQWTLTPTRDGTRVEITHAFSFPHRTIAWFVEHVIGRYFVQPIARQTLAAFKKALEGTPAAA